MSLYAPNNMEELNSINAACQQAAKDAHRNSKPRRESSAQLEEQIVRLVGGIFGRTTVEGRLPMIRRHVMQHEAHRAEVIEAIDKATAKIAALREASVSERDYRLQKLVGYDFIDSADRRVHQNGLVEDLKEELTRTEKRLVMLREGLKKTEEHVERELPDLKARLAEAKRFESL